jgi:hypothetical protein
VTSVPDDALTAPPASEDTAAPGGTLTLPPLTVSALMVTKADLIAALRVYLPHLSDIEAIDGEQILLSVVAPPVQDGAS